jgi:anaerobic ribonucleoside-triphosphate reductase
MKIIKTNKKEENFNIMKIITVLHKANEKSNATSEDIKKVANIVDIKAHEIENLTTEKLRTIIENVLIENGLTDLARNYIIGNYKNDVKYQLSKLDESILDIISNSNTEVALENSNKNARINSTQRDYVAGEVSKSLYYRILGDKDVVEADKKGIIHRHDKDYYIQPMLNCCLINIEDMLQNGTNISGVQIDKPKSLRTAATIVSQISGVVASNQYGGQTINLGHLVPFVNISREKIKNKVKEDLALLNLNTSEEKINELVEKELKKEIQDSVQTMNYQWNTISSTNGQTPFVSLFMYINEQKDERNKSDLVLLIEEFLKQRIKGVKNSAGVYVTQTFPKLLYVLDETNVYEDRPYFWLTELAAQCTAKRMVPDYISEKVMLKNKKNKYGESVVVPPMGCRSQLSVLDEEPNRLWGRANLGVVTLNLPYVALESKGNPIEFWKLFDKYSNLIKKAQLDNYKKLLGTTSDVAPTLWQYGAYTRLQPGEKIDSYLTKDNCTVSFGYAGLYEAVKYMTGKSHTDSDAKDFAIAIMRKMNEYCELWKNETNLGWGVYGTPLESTTEKFAKACIRDFGTIDGETIKNYVTNSYHVVVREQIDAFTKFDFESEFQELSNGGAISYVEIPNMINNIPAVVKIIQYIYEHIMYAELNCKSDYCFKCGFDGELEAHRHEDGSQGWICPECGNDDTDKLSIVRRSCGYLGSQTWADGRYEEIIDRVLHL